MKLKKSSLSRIYHPYTKLEEVEAGMWDVVQDEEFCLKETTTFMQDTARFGKAMIQVTCNWGYSCEHNLTNNEQNKVAWLGQAACAFALRTPEDITRKAWGFLTSEEQAAANRKAIRAIEVWEGVQHKKRPPKDGRSVRKKKTVKRKS